MCVVKWNLCSNIPVKLFVFYVLHHIEYVVFLPYLGVIEINLSALELTKVMFSRADSTHRLNVSAITELRFAQER